MMKARYSGLCCKAFQYFLHRHWSSSSAAAGKFVSPPPCRSNPCPFNVHHTIFGLVYTSRHSRYSGVQDTVFLSSWAAVIDGACYLLVLYYLTTSTSVPSTREETVSESQACAGASVIRPTTVRDQDSWDTMSC